MGMPSSPLPPLPALVFMLLMYLMRVKQALGCARSPFRLSPLLSACIYAS